MEHIMYTQITFVRHGHNVPYAEGELKYPGPGLSKNGIAQAKKTAIYLKDFKFDRIYCSDMTRAMETAKEIKKYQRQKISYHRELAEVNRAIYDKKSVTKEELKEHISKIKITLYFFKKILKENKGKKILVVAHGNVIRALIGTSLGIAFDDAPSFHICNCSISTLVFEKGKIVGLPQLCYADHHSKKGFKENLDNYHEKREFYKNPKNRMK
jgi:broad specificity phosphatase PhoE